MYKRRRTGRRKRNLPSSFYPNKKYLKSVYGVDNVQYIPPFNGRMGVVTHVNTVSHVLTWPGDPVISSIPPLGRFFQIHGNSIKQPLVGPTYAAVEHDTGFASTDATGPTETDLLDKFGNYAVLSSKIVVQFFNQSSHKIDCFINVAYDKDHGSPSLDDLTGATAGQPAFRKIREYRKRNHFVMKRADNSASNQNYGNEVTLSMAASTKSILPMHDIDLDNLIATSSTPADPTALWYFEVGYVPRETDIIGGTAPTQTKVYCTVSLRQTLLLLDHTIEVPTDN